MWPKREGVLRHDGLRGLDHVADIDVAVEFEPEVFEINWVDVAAKGRWADCDDDSEKHTSQLRCLREIAPPAMGPPMVCPHLSFRRRGPAEKRRKGSSAWRPEEKGTLVWSTANFDERACRRECSSLSHMRSAEPSIRRRRGLLPHLTSFTSWPAGAVCYRNTMPDAQAPFVEPGYALAGSAWDAEHGADEAVDATAVPESDVGDSLDKHNRDHNHQRIVPNRSYPPDSRHCVQSICCYSENGEYCKSGK